MNKIISLNKNSDFRRIYTRGRSFVSPVLVTYILQNRMSSGRVGITTSKKTGNAVKRNRARRIIREAYRRISFGAKRKADLVFVSRARTSEVKMGDVFRSMQNHLKKAGLID